MARRARRWSAVATRRARPLVQHGAGGVEDGGDQLGVAGQAAHRVGGERLAVAGLAHRAFMQAVDEGGVVDEHADLRRAPPRTRPAT